MFGGRSSSRRAGAAGLLLAAALLGGCSAGGDDDATACEVLGQRLPAATFGPGTINLNAPPSTQTGDVLAWTLRALDRERSTVNVYLDPGSTDDDVDDLAAQLDERPGVTGTASVGVMATYDDFRKLFDGNEEMLANVRPEDLPPSVRVQVAHDDADDLASWAEQQPGVYETRDPADAADGLLAQTLTKQADRDAWTDLAEQLDRVEDDPEWATTGAAAIRQLLDEGADAQVDDEAGITDARDQLDEAIAACQPS